MKNVSLKSITALLLCISMLAALLAGCGSSSAAPEQESAGLTADEAYELAVSAEEVEPEQLYSVVSPMGENNVEQIEMAPRLDTLDGKKIALVGGSFQAAITHGELARLLRENYPTATLYMFNEVGEASTYNLFNPSDQVRQFQARLQELGIDAVITGNCG